jgi:hypothetical protein
VKSRKIHPHRPRARPKITRKSRGSISGRTCAGRNPQPSSTGPIRAPCSDQQHKTLEIRTRNPIETAPARKDQPKTHQKPWKKPNLESRVCSAFRARNSRDAESSTSVLEPSPSSNDRTLRNRNHPAIRTREKPRPGFETFPRHFRSGKRNPRRGREFGADCAERSRTTAYRSVS